MHEGHRERLRKRYIENGFEGLAEHEQLELLLTYVLPRRDTNPISHNLIDKFGSLSAVLEANVFDLMQVEGVGERMAAFLCLCGELRRMPEKEIQKMHLRTPGEAFAYCRCLFKAAQGEQLYLISLDKNKRVLHADLITRGTPTRTAMYPRLVVECALRHHACSVIMAHNHPSGDVRPSREDVDATLAVRNALSSIDIPLFDHLIIGRGKGYSFNLSGIIPDGESEPQELGTEQQKECFD